MKRKGANCKQFVNYIISYYGKVVHLYKGFNFIQTDIGLPASVQSPHIHKDFLCSAYLFKKKVALSPRAVIEGNHSIVVRIIENIL